MCKLLLEHPACTSIDDNEVYLCCIYQVYMYISYCTCKNIDADFFMKRVNAFLCIADRKIWSRGQTLINFKGATQ